MNSSAPLSIYQSPSERLASSLKRSPAPTKDDQDIHSSIRQVTSAIVHYVSENPAVSVDVDEAEDEEQRRSRTLPPSGRARSPSPRRPPRCLWVESSFVGSNPSSSLSSSSSSSEAPSSSSSSSLLHPNTLVRSERPAPPVPAPALGSGLVNQRPGELMRA